MVTVEGYNRPDYIREKFFLIKISIKVNKQTKGKNITIGARERQAGAWLRALSQQGIPCRRHASLRDAYVPIGMTSSL